MNKPQIIFTKSDRMTEKQRLFFDMLYAWGRSRFNLLVGMANLIFTEEEMRNPENCLIRLEAMVLHQSRVVPQGTSNETALPNPENEVPVAPVAEPEAEEDDIRNAFARQMANAHADYRS